MTMMISWIVASHDRAVLEANLLATLRLEGDDELIVVDSPASIAAGYNEGGKRSSNEVRCFVHHDAQILDSVRLRGELLKHCGPDVGMVGLIGSKTPAIPWWLGERCGSASDNLHGRLDWGAGDTVCAYLDGLLLATAHEMTWDETYDGFHFYDYDSCQQWLARGVPNYCLADGAGLVFHNGAHENPTGRPPEWDKACRRFVEKWG